MIVDFHAHAFPDALAERSVAYLAAKAGIEHYSDGTVRGLAASAAKVKADGALVLPVVTKPSQFKSVNAEAALATLVSRGVIVVDGTRVNWQQPAV